MQPRIQLHLWSRHVCGMHQRRCSCAPRCRARCCCLVWCCLAQRDTWKWSQSRRIRMCAAPTVLPWNSRHVTAFSERCRTWLCQALSISADERLKHAGAWSTLPTPLSALHISLETRQKQETLDSAAWAQRGMSTGDHHCKRALRQAQTQRVTPPDSRLISVSYESVQSV